MFEYIVACVIALGIGIVAAVIGLGGGFFYVPTLSILFNLDVKTAMGTSLAVMIFSSFSASFWYRRQGKILYKVALILMPPAILFSVIGSIITHYIDARILVAIFSCRPDLGLAGDADPGVPVPHGDPVWPLLCALDNGPVTTNTASHPRPVLASPLLGSGWWPCEWHHRHKRRGYFCTCACHHRGAGAIRCCHLHVHHHRHRTSPARSPMLRRARSHCHL